MKHVLPKWFYHKVHFPEGKIIRTQEEFDGMPNGFVDSPADFDNDDPKSPEEIINHARESIKEVVSRPSKTKHEKAKN